MSLLYNFVLNVFTVIMRFPTISFLLCIRYCFRLLNFSLHHKMMFGRGFKNNSLIFAIDNHSQTNLLMYLQLQDRRYYMWSYLHCLQKNNLLPWWLLLVFSDCIQSTETVIDWSPYCAPPASKEKSMR